MNITTSIPDDLGRLAREKCFKWNDLLLLGLKTALNQPLVLQKGETIEQESYKSLYEGAMRREKSYLEVLNKISIDALQEQKKKSEKGVENGKTEQ